MTCKIETEVVKRDSNLAMDQPLACLDHCAADKATGPDSVDCVAGQDTDEMSFCGPTKN